MIDSENQPRYIINFDGIPAALKGERRWIPWKWRRKDNKWTKVPQLKGWQKPENWMSFEQAYGAHDECGVGFVLGDGWCGVDLDDCRDDRTGELSELATKVLNLLKSYTEISPSQTGVKAICRADFAGKGTAMKNETGKKVLEVYSTGRYFAFTGEPLLDSDEQPIYGRKVEDRQAEFAAIHARYIAPKGMLAKLLTIEKTREENDGSNRLIRVARKCAELDIPQVEAIEYIKQYQAIIPFPNPFSDSDIATRLTDAGAREKSFKNTDLGNAERFASQHKDIRYCFEWGCWLVYDGTRWAKDGGDGVSSRAKQTVRGIYAEAQQYQSDDRRSATAKWAINSESAKRLSAMTQLARGELPIKVEQLNTDPWLFNCLNGTIDLRTGKLRPHSPADYITCVAPVRYDEAEPTLFLQFLKEIQPDAEIVDFLQRLFGAALVGEVRDEVFVIFHGDGSNGKSVLGETILKVFGDDYGGPAPPDFIKVQRNSPHPTELADFYGKRIVIASETEEGCKLSEAKIKHVTGRDLIKARFMRGDYWAFTPSHTLFLISNYEPIIVGKDYAIWRRIKKVPFNVTFTEEQADKELTHKLKAERGQILAWMVKGCLAWQEHGLKAPAAVQAATAEFKNESDTFGRFVADCLVDRPDAKLSRKGANEVYKRWADENGEEPLTARQMVSRMEALYEPATSDGVRYWRGVELRGTNE